MNSSSHTHTRRDMLKLFAASTTVTLLSGLTSSCSLWDDDLESAAREMVKLLNYPERAREIAAIQLARFPELQRYSSDQWTRQLLTALEIEPENIPPATMNSLQSRLRKKIKQDFVDENVVIVKRWMLSDTELKLFSLAASIADS